MHRAFLCFLAWLVASATILSCGVDSIDFTGKTCSTGQCPAGYVCQVTTHECKREETPTILCDAHSPVNACARSGTSTSLTCFAATQLGGHDFCVEACDPSEASTDTNVACVSPGTRLQTCHPIEARTAAVPVCPAGLSCIATDLISDSGFCLPPCGPGDDCVTPIAPCDSSAVDNTCSTASNGDPMTCFAASALLGQDFCTEACDPNQPPTDPAFTCTASGSLLQICKPSAASGDPGACPPGLSCYRRDVLADTGLCIAMTVCTDNMDCPGMRHCTATKLRELVSNSPISSVLHTDHLNCVVDECLTSGTPCPAGQGCLAKPYFTGGVADFCVPRCDSKSNCPPNYSCAVGASGSGPSLCFPGTLGVRCVDDKGCAGGTCQDTGAGFKVCAVDCLSDAKCALLSAQNYSFVCVSGGDHQHCVTPTVFSAPNCDPQLPNCPVNQRCFPYAPLGAFAGHEAECRFPCDASGQCAAFGGLVHVCLAGGAGGCYPAVFGIPCQSECIADLQCLDVPAEVGSMSSGGTKICTVPCSTDADCDADPWTDHVGYCESAFCRRGRPAGGACARDAQCASRVCTDGTCG